MISRVIAETQEWIRQVVIGCNFCPFAAREMRLGRIHYQVETGSQRACLEAAVVAEWVRLDEQPDTETSFLIFPAALHDLDDYLRLVSWAERRLKRDGYEGVYQLASFHPLYCFADSAEDDAANYTNRSPYPMLHLLREESLEQALLSYPNPERIPEDNIAFARRQGVAAMRRLRETCLDKDSVNSQ